MVIKALLYNFESTKALDYVFVVAAVVATALQILFWSAVLVPVDKQKGNDTLDVPRGKGAELGQSEKEGLLAESERNRRYSVARSIMRSGRSLSTFSSSLIFDIAFDLPPAPIHFSRKSTVRRTGKAKDVFLSRSFILQRKLKTTAMRRNPLTDLKSSKQSTSPWIESSLID